MKKDIESRPSLQRLTERLKSLGVSVGAADIPTTPKLEKLNIEEVLEGFTFRTPLGEALIVEKVYPYEYQHGRFFLKPPAKLHNISKWANIEFKSELPNESLIFLDIETTGLSGGTGTLAFLVGIGRFTEKEFHLYQIFLCDPSQEQAQLVAIEQYISESNVIVTFNGKAFDIPLLNTRFISHGWKTPFKEFAHIDLLHLARLLWKERLPSRSLSSLEANILYATRSQEDIPGWMIPDIYFDYLQNDNIHPLKNVFYHNEMDVLSLAVLFNYTANLLSDPLNAEHEHGLDVISLGRICEYDGKIDTAIEIYMHGLDYELPDHNRIETLSRLALIHKRKTNFEDALSLWKKAAQYKNVEAHIELAKYYEHHVHDYITSRNWTEAAILLVNETDFPQAKRQYYLNDLIHRLNRLYQKAA